MWKLELDSKFLVSLLFYMIVVGFGIFSIYFESRDINNKKHLEGTEYEKGDTEEDIKDKISQAAKYENNVICWRRSYILAAIASFFLVIILKNKIPNGIELGISFLFIYILIYMTGIIYKKWLTKSSTDRIDELLQKL